MHVGLREKDRFRQKNMGVGRKSEAPSGGPEHNKIRKVDNGQDLIDSEPGANC